jgi:xanthine dehydrogenase YagS FAD-binding subunit
MHPFALSRAKDLAKAVAAHAMDEQLAFIAGGTDLLGLIKDHAAAPQRPIWRGSKRCRTGAYASAR